MNERYEKFAEKFRGREHLEDVGVDEKLMLKYLF